MNFRKAKALNSFLKDKVPFSKKYKSIQKFLAQDFSSNPEELKKFWVEHHTEVYNLLLIKFTEFDDASKKGIKTSFSRIDIISFMEVFKKLILALVEVGQLTTKLDQTAMILKRALHRNNTHRLRGAAFEVLLLVLAEISSMFQPNEPINSSHPISFGNSLQWSSPPTLKRSTLGTAGRAELALLSTFGHAIDLRAFNSSALVNWKKDIDNEEGPPLCASHSAPTPAKSMEMLEKLLERMSKSEASFLFWYDLFRDAYLTKFYVPRDDPSQASIETLNFVAGCPPIIQIAIIDNCALWNESVNRSQIMWEGDNASLMMLIGKQSFALPLQYPKTIRKSLNMFRNTLMNVPKMKNFGNRLQSYWQEFIGALSHVFDITVEEPYWDAYRNLCKEVIGIYYHFYTILSDRLVSATWEKLLDAMLYAAVSVVETCSGNDDHLLDLAMRRLYFFWVTSSVPGKDMWNRFGQRMNNLLHWRGTITHWKDRVLELTQMVLHYSEDKSEPFMKPLESPSRNNELYTDSMMPSWSYKDIFARWVVVLNIFGNITHLADAENHRIGMSCILEIVNILSETNSTFLNNTVKTIPKPTKVNAKMSPNSSEILSEPASLTSNSSNNMSSHSRNSSLDYNKNNHSSETSPQSTPILTPTPSFPNSSTSAESIIPFQLDPPVHPTIPTFKLNNHNNNPSTPMVQGRFQSSNPTLAPPTGHTQSSDLNNERRNSSENIKPSDCPKREDIAISILTAVLPWVVESCCDDLRFASHLQGVLCAFQSLCRVLSSTNFTFDIDINMRFCTCLHMGFWASKEIASKIICSSSRMFNLCRPGLTTVIPEYLKQIKALFSDAAGLSPELEVAASTIVNSLICYPSHFGDLGYVRIETSHKPTRFTLEELKTELAQCMMIILKRSTSIESKLSALCGACVLMLEELFNERPRREMITNFCDHILSFCHHHNELIAQTALDVLSALSHSNIASVDRALISTIIMCLCDSASSLMNEKQDFHGKENVILAHFWCLIEWIIPTSPTATHRLSTPTVLSKLLDVVELGFYGAKLMHPFEFEDSNSSHRESLFRKKREHMNTSMDHGQKKTDFMKKKRRDSLFETSVDLKAIVESPKLSSRKEIAINIVKDVFRRGRDDKEKHKDKDKDKDKEKDRDRDREKCTTSDPLSQLRDEEEAEENEKTNSGSKKSAKHSATPSTKLKEVAETLLLCVLNHYQSFPLFIGCSTVEDETVPAIYFLHNNKAVWSFSDLTDDNNEPYTRVIVRDSTGKYVWNFKPCPNRDVPKPPPPPFLTPRRKASSPPLSPSSPPMSPTYARSAPSSSSLNPPAATPTNSPSHSPASSPSSSPRESEQVYHRIKGQVPKFSTNGGSSRVDMLHHFIEYLCDNCPEVVDDWLQTINQNQQNKEPNAAKIAIAAGLDDGAERSYIINPEFYKYALDTKQNVLRQAAIEHQFYTSFVPSLRLTPMEKPSTLTKATYFETTRQLLSNFGFLSPENRQSMVRLEESGKLVRNLKALDSISERENFKVGVLFIDKGQTTQKEVLSNSKGTQDYTNFLQGLGWEIDLATHKGFAGGLDSNNGTTSIYSASSTYEVIYHVVTMMPTVASDEAQFHKKRHIGNDNVHIVWSDNPADSYDPNTIQSQFNHAHIIIYPQANGLCQIQICKKFKVHFFGPLVNGMLVSKKILPFLVRQTAINANKRVRERTAGYNKPYNIRMTRIQEIAGTCQKNSKSFEEFFTALYRPLGSFTPSQDNLSSLPSPILSSSSSTNVAHSHHPSHTLKTNSERSLRSDTSLDSIDESDEDSSVEVEVENSNSNSNFSNSMSESDSSEIEVKVRFKVPKIKIPQSRSTQYVATPPGDASFELLSP